MRCGNKAVLYQIRVDKQVQAIVYMPICQYSITLITQHFCATLKFSANAV